MERQQREALEQRLEGAQEAHELTKSEMIMERCEQYVSKQSEKCQDMPAQVVIPPLTFHDRMQEDKASVRSSQLNPNLSINKSFGGL